MEGLSIGWMIARIIVYAAAGLGMCFGIFQILNLGHRQAWIKRGWRFVLERSQKTLREREMVYQKQYEETGMQEKMSFIQRWDQMYSQSMIQKRIPVLNGQLFAGMLLIIASVAGLCGLILCRSTPGIGLLAGIGLFAAVFVAGLFCVNLLRRKRWSQTEQELVPFLNIIDNFSKSEQDLFQIFELSVPFLREPVRTALKECGQHAAATGNRMEAIRHLMYSIQHPKFREMIQNLEICSKNEGNYTRIMGDMREGISSYLSNRKEEKSILRQGQIQMIVIIALGIPMIGMLSMITQVSIAEMAGNLFGRLIIGYWAILIAIIVWQMFFSMGRAS